MRHFKNETAKRSTEITIETHSITIIRTKGKSISTHCECCQRTVTAIPLPLVAELLKLDLAEICRRIESQKIHLNQTTRGMALVCGSIFEKND